MTYCPILFTLWHTALYCSHCDVLPCIVHIVTYCPILFTLWHTALYCSHCDILPCFVQIVTYCPVLFTLWRTALYCSDCDILPCVSQQILYTDTTTATTGEEWRHKWMFELWLLSLLLSYLFYRCVGMWLGCLYCSVLQIPPTPSLHISSSCIFSTKSCWGIFIPHISPPTPPPRRRLIPQSKYWDYFL